jgi:hypothetical protein
MVASPIKNNGIEVVSLGDTLGVEYYDPNAEFKAYCLLKLE